MMCLKEQLEKLSKGIWLWSFWQKTIGLIILPISLGMLIFYLISLKIFWFAALVFVISIIYFILALIINIKDRNFDIKIFGGWISIRKPEDET